MRKGTTAAGEKMSQTFYGVSFHPLFNAFHSMSLAAQLTVLSCFKISHFYTVRYVTRTIQDCVDETGVFVGSFSLRHCFCFSAQWEVILRHRECCEENFCQEASVAVERVSYGSFSQFSLFILRAITPYQHNIEYLWPSDWILSRGCKPQCSGSYRLVGKRNVRIHLSTTAQWVLQSPSNLGYNHNFHLYISCI